MLATCGLYLLFGFTASAAAQASCSLSVSSQVPAPSVAPGFEARLIATNLTSPRGIKFDDSGHLLVVEQESGITALTLNDAGASCLSEKSRTTVINDTSLNHGIALSSDGKTLYASSAEAVYSYPYDEETAQVTGNGTTIVANMTTSDHTTRTLLLSQEQNGTLVVTRGSTSNIDPEAAQLSTGHSQIKAFNLNNLTSRPYDFNADGRLLGWGLRNDVGIDEQPRSGGLYSVENSADEVMRNNQDIHENNPAEKMNFFGWLQPPQGTEQSPNQGSNFGYPQCFAAWDPSSIPDFTGQVGTQFAIDSVNSTNNDSTCVNDFTPPTLVFQAHMAPLDIKFNSQGSEAWITFHGSWDRTAPSGYKVGAVAFNGSGPVMDSSSNTALTDVVTNVDNSACPDHCFRPVAMAWDSQGRLYFSSDSTGEIYVIAKAGSGSGGGVDGAALAATASNTTVTVPAATATRTSNAPLIRVAPSWFWPISVFLMVWLTAL